MKKDPIDISKGSLPPKRDTNTASISRGPIMSEEDKRLNKLFQEQIEHFKKLDALYKPLSKKNTYYEKVIKEYIIGQDQGVKELIYIVYHNMHQNMMSDYHGLKPQCYSAVVVGPSGCGKTATLTKISELFGIPFVKYNATPLTSGGFVGKDVENMLNLLIDAAGGDIELAERGILYIDEIDKKVSSQSSNTSGRDINGTAVQEELLKFLEPSVVDLGHGKTFNVSHLTVLMSGRFIDIEKIIKKRLRGNSSIGFNPKNSSGEIESYEDFELLFNEFDESKSERCTHLDIAKFGFLDEFVGRLYSVITFNTLTRSNLMDIIFAKDSPLQLFNEALKIKGQELYIDLSNYERMVDAAINSPLGARSLESIIRKFLVPADLDFMLNYRPGIMEYDAMGNYSSIFETPEYGQYVYNYVEGERSKKLRALREMYFDDDKQALESSNA